jgi:alpha-galactosidase
VSGDFSCPLFPPGKAKTEESKMLGIDLLKDSFIPGWWASVLEQSPGFLVETANGPLDWQVASNPTTKDGLVEWVLRSAKADIRAEVRLAPAPKHGAMTVQIALVNESPSEAPPLAVVEPWYLSFEPIERKRLAYRVLGGGTTDSFYPPRAFRERTGVGRSGPSDPIRIESGPDGRSSNGDLPFLALKVDADGGSSGIVVGMEWSGMWYQQFSYQREGETTPVFQAGIPIDGLRLAPGEILNLPKVHVVFFEGDLDDGGNALRRYIYDQICPDVDGQRPLPPLSYDHWFGIRGEMDEQLLRGLADRAAELEVDYFVVDAGWFSGCGPGARWSLGAGNWEIVDAEKFPNGLEPLGDYVRSLGMKFGLWFGLERAHVESDLAKRHRDWFIDIGNEFLHLNLALTEAQDYLIEMVGGWIRRLDLRWIRWDYNFGPKPYWLAADPTGKIQFAYIEGFYRVLDSLMNQNPQLLLECCASGGRRIDLGTLRRAQTVWCSDHTADAHICRCMQTGASRFLPGNYFNSSIPVTRGEKNVLTHPQILCRMVGALSFNGDITMWDPASMDLARRYARMFRDVRHLLVEDFYPLTQHPASEDDWDVVEFVDAKRTQAAVYAFRVRGQARETVRLRSLSPDSTYLVQNLVTEEALPPQSGAALMEEGLSMELEENDACLYLVTAQ